MPRRPSGRWGPLNKAEVRARLADGWLLYERGPIIFRVYMERPSKEGGSIYTTERVHRTAFRALVASDEIEPCKAPRGEPREFRTYWRLK